jgi:uncharacterized protein with NRDE domain
MCILFIAKHQHPEYPLIICANRDEFHQRPTQNMHYWNDDKILAGQDLQAGGTWLGMNKNKQFSALTNFRLGATIDKSKRSRGELVLNALNSTIEGTANYLADNAEHYQGFNLVFGDINELHCFDSVNKTNITIDDGFHSICNGALDDIWPKMQKGLDSLAKVIKKNEKLDVEQLFALMSCQIKAEHDKLPKTGISIEKEKLLSSIFITSPDYGTRSTCLILVDKQQQVQLYEQGYDNLGHVVQAQHFTIE